MTIGASNWQPGQGSVRYKSAVLETAREKIQEAGYGKETAENVEETAGNAKAAAGGAEETAGKVFGEQEGKGQEADTDVLTKHLEAFSRETSGDTGGGMKMKASTPDDSVGSLAAMLARAETKLDVQQVSSKAMRALINMKAAAPYCEEGDKRKVQRMIKRMEKLLKQINKKLKALGKEEELQRRKEKAAKKQDEVKEKQLENELLTRRKKRRKEERSYAMRELAEDNKEAANEMTQALAQGMSSSPAGGGSLSADIGSVAGAGAAAAGAGTGGTMADAGMGAGAADVGGMGIAVDVAMTGAVSFDVTV